MFTFRTSHAFRQSVLTTTLVVLTGILFGSIAYLREKQRVEQAQVDSLQNQASAAAYSISRPEWFEKRSSDTPGLLLRKAWEELNADGPQPPVVVIFARMEEGSDYLVPVVNTGTKEIDINSGRYRNALSVPGAEVALLENTAGDGTQKTLSRMGSFLGTSWGYPRRIIATAPVRAAGEAKAQGVIWVEETRPANVIAWADFNAVLLPAFLGMVLLSVAVSTVMSRRFSNEVDKMKKGIDELRGGRYEYRIEVHREDEIGIAQSYINELAHCLESAKATQAETMRALERSKKDAEMAAVTKSDFLANMSHEIRTPMNGILGAINLLKDSELSTSQKDLAKIISTSCQSLLHVINGILDLSKLDSDKMDLDSRSMKVNDLVEEVGDLYTTRCAEKNLELVFDSDPLLSSPVYGDFERLKQILSNLVNNSLKFTEKGEIVIRTRLVNSEKKGAMIQYEVQDSGIGIERDMLEKIFEPFQQADVSTTRKYGGSGLGLAISRKLAELMGGRLYAESVYGKGSTFILQVPLRLVASNGEAEVIEGVEELRGKTAEILCLNPVLAQVLKSNLSQRGMNVQLIDYQSLRTGALKYDDQLLIVDWLPEEAEDLRELVLERARQRYVTIVLAPYGQELNLPDHESSCLRTVFKPVRGKSLIMGIRSAIKGVALELPHQNDASDEPEIGNSRAPKISSDPEETPSKAAPLANEFPAKILVVEDNPMNQKIVSMMLKRLGYSVDIANNGREGVDAVVNAKDYDIVFMDLQMPVMGGIDATQEIRGSLLLERQPAIVALTGYALDGVRQSCMKVGMDGFLTKPVSVVDLRDAITNLLSNRPRTEGAESEKAA